MDILCKICGISFHIKPSHLEVRKCCSKVCFGKWISIVRKGHLVSNSSRKKISITKKGIKFTKEHIENLRISHLGQIPPNKGKGYLMPRGKNHHAWKGDKVGYYALHDWVRSKLGIPEICEHCGKKGLREHKIHWANKSHEYKRNISDWLRLCVKCHKKYDSK